MVNRFLLFLFLFLFSLVSSCAPVISPELRAKVDSSLSFQQVLQSPDTYKGKFVLWGGEIIKILPQDGDTYIEVLQRSVGWRGKPEESSASQGKFLILTKELLDLSLFKKGKKITVAGEIQDAIQGDKIKNLSEATYRYPIVLSKQIHLWKGLYPYSSIPQYQYYPDPYQYDPFERGLRF